jgi:hypothetical protein
MDETVLLEEKVSIRNLQKIREVRFSNVHEFAKEIALTVTKNIFELLNRGAVVIDGDIAVRQKDNYTRAIADCLLVDPQASTAVKEQVERVRTEHVSVHVRYREMMKYLKEFSQAGRHSIGEQIKEILRGVEDGEKHQLISIGVAQVIYLSNLLGKPVSEEFLHSLDVHSETILKVLDNLIEELCGQGEELDITEFKRISIRKFKRKTSSTLRSLGFKIIHHQEGNLHELHRILRDYREDMNAGATSCVGVPSYPKHRLSEKVCRWIATGECKFLVVQGKDIGAIEVARNLWGVDSEHPGQLRGATVVPILTTYRTGSLYLVVPKGDENLPILLAVHPNSLLRLAAIAGPATDLGVLPEQVTFAIEETESCPDHLQSKYDQDMQAIHNELDEHISRFLVVGKEFGSIDDLVQEIVLTQRPKDYIHSLGRVQPHRLGTTQYLGAVQAVFVKGDPMEGTKDKVVLVFGVGSGDKQYGDGAGRTILAFFRTFTNTSDFVFFGATVGLLIDGNSSYVGSTVIPSKTIASADEHFEFRSIFDMCSDEHLRSLSLDPELQAEIRQRHLRLRRQLLVLGVNFTKGHWGVPGPFVETNLLLRRVMEHWRERDVILETIDVEHLPIARALRSLKEQTGRDIWFTPVNVCSDSAWEGSRTPELSLGFTQPYFESQDCSQWYAALVAVQNFSSYLSAKLEPYRMRFDRAM